MDYTDVYNSVQRQFNEKRLERRQRQAEEVQYLTVCNGLILYRLSSIQSHMLNENAKNLKRNKQIESEKLTCMLLPR